MPDRGLLHISKLEEFKAWLTAQGIAHRPGRGDWQVLQIQKWVAKDQHQWYAIYSTARMTEHYSVQHPLIALVRQFLRAQCGLATTYADPNANKEKTDDASGPPW